MPAARSKATLPIDVGLLRAIHACAREYGVDNEALHEAIEAGFAKTSLKTLTRAEAYKLLDGLRAGRESEYYKPNAPRRHAQANHGRRSYDASADAIYPVTERERQILRDAAALRNWDTAALDRFITRQIGKPAVTTMGEFNKILWPLKSMNRRDGLHA